MAATPASASAKKTPVLDSIVTVLSLAKAGVTGIGIPAVEPVFNGIYELAQMLSIMRSNKEDLAALEKSLNNLAAIHVSDADGDLKNRLTTIASKFRARAEECKLLGSKSRVKRFFRSQEYKEQISDIQDRVAADIREFTFSGNISIEKLVRNICLKADNAILDKLKSSPARYNAANTPQECMNGTRVDIINSIVSQLTNPVDPNQRVVILSGSAGSGKSTIAKSVASILAERKKVLAASFFFAWDSAERNHLKPLPTTLARQLADHDDCFRHLFVKLITEDCTGILDMDPHLQFQKLVVELLAQMPPTQTPWVICLDALDECGKDRGVLCLRWLSDNMDKIPKNVRFFLTGRPNVPQYLQFDKLHSLVHAIILDDIDTSQVRQDIHLFVEKSLDGSTWNVRDSWKARPQDVKQIAAQADGLFVFAATAVRYICSAVPQVHPQDSMNFLLGGDPLTDIHELYYRVVSEAIVIPDPKSLRAQNYYKHIKRILRTIVLLLKPQSPQALAQFLGMDVEDLIRTLHPLSAIIQIHHEGGTIKIIHLSFREFLMSTIQEKRLDLLCGTETQKEEIASEILQIMETSLKFNICNLPTSYLKNVDMPNIKQSIQACIPEHLQYACQFWADHVTAISYNHEHGQTAERFLLNKFLFWLETLSLLGVVGSAYQTLSKFIAWAPVESAGVHFAQDGKRFVAFFAGAIQESAPHIYLSALALAPTQSRITEIFGPQFQYLPSVRKGQLKRWPSNIRVLDHISSVNCVAFSPDGKQIVSGCYNGTVHLWDAESGEAVGQPFVGHTDWVNSVAFSPDGKQIVSGSNDMAVRLWDAESGEAVGQPFEGHTDRVDSVAFSPDGKQIVSGSYDKSVFLWDAESVEVQAQRLEGHTSWVNSVAFSPDGRQIVSGSSDWTVCLWDARSGETVGQPFEGHTDRVNSVAFSPDGKQIISGSYDRSVCLWNAESVEAQAQRLEGHTDWVNSVAFSPDGRQIVSGSSDRTMRLWDAKSGKAAGQPLEGHTDWVNSVAFSPDGKWIISGSYDKTVHLWDAESGEAVGPPFMGHAGGITSVAFSPDGKQIVSGSDDRTVCLWDAESGKAVGQSFEIHTDRVNSVAFSPDGKQIVSGSYDRSVCLWDAESVEAQAQRLEGHTDWVNSVAFSPDGRQIVSGSDDMTVHLWDAESGEAVGQPFEGHTDRVKSVAFSPDGKQIVSGSYDRSVCLWDAENVEAQAQRLEGHTDWVNSVAFSPDGKQIVSGSSDGTVCLWDAKSGEPVGQPLEGHTDWVNSVAFSPDGKWIVSGSKDRTVRLWGAKSGEAVGLPFEGHADYVMCVAFSPDGSQIVSSSNDGTLRLWDINATQSWSLHGGWVYTDPSNLLVWLPNHNRIGFWTPSTKLVISVQQTEICFDNCVHGEEWVNSYIPQ